MDFYICFDPSKISLFEINYCSNLQIIEKKSNVLYIEKLNHLDYVEQQSGEFIQLAVGDVILNDLGRITLNDTRGIFYSFMFGTDHKFLEISPDNFSLLPIYYMNQDGCIHISSSFFLLSKLAKNKTINQNFHLEIALFYTQINGSTFLTTINRLEFGQSIVLNDEFKVKQNKRFYDYFVDKPSPYKASLKRMADSFIENSKYYLNEPSAISLTGGFDGRIVTGCAHYYGTQFTNFSYGNHGSGDVDNPIWISKILGLKYHLLELDKDYLKNNYVASVQEYIKLSGGFNGFQYPQSLHFAREMSNLYKVIVTGYLGNDVLANVRESDDEVHPQTVIDLLNNIKLCDNHAYKLLSFLNQLDILNESKSIDNSLEQLKHFFDSLPKGLTLNQKYATFSFENIFRNTFGVWIYNGMHYAKIRVPFIDKNFFTELVKTEVSGFYRTFLEKNSYRRILGQLFYPVVLKIVCPELSALNSSKGYSPNELLSIDGKLKIAFRRTFKINVFKEKNGLDKLSTISGAKLFIQNSTNKTINKIEEEHFLTLMSQNTLHRYLCFLSLSKAESKYIF